MMYTLSLAPSQSPVILIVLLYYFYSDTIDTLSTAMTTSDIPIKFINATLTGSLDAGVVVFTKNSDVSTPQAYYVAWQVLPIRSEISEVFVYPAATAVGATYDENNVTVTAGPFPAELGSTWRIDQETERDTATLTKGVLSIQHCMYGFGPIHCTILL